MSWKEDELRTIGSSEEIQIAPRRRDGTLRARLTIWAVSQGDAVYIRSAVKGRSATWYRATEDTHQGRIWAGGIHRDVEFVKADNQVNDEIDAAYRVKYRRYAGPILNSCLTPECARRRCE